MRVLFLKKTTIDSDFSRKNQDSINEKSKSQMEIPIYFSKIDKEPNNFYPYSNHLKRLYSKKSSFYTKSSSKSN